MSIGNLPEFSRLICTLDFDIGETNIKISASSNECGALARRFSIEKLQYLSATLNFFKSNTKDPVSLNASYAAEIKQICVVTLEPLTNIICGNFSSSLVKKNQSNNDKSFILDINDIDQTEIMENGIFDAGELVSEFLSLEIDPFPRAHAVEFKNEITFTAESENKKNNPFTMLKKLQIKEK